MRVAQCHERVEAVLRENMRAVEVLLGGERCEVEYVLADGDTDPGVLVADREDAVRQRVDAER